MPEPEKTEEAPKTPDVRAIQHLVKLMKRYDLTAIDLVEGPTKIRLRRQGAGSPVVYAAQPAAPQPIAAAPAAAATPAPAAGATPPAPVGVVIESPMVGTFYSSSSPDAAPFVTVGTSVHPEATVCVIEAMKVFTDIPARVAGTITEILVKNGQPVEFGQPMFRVNPA
ncbi:acetyl-CoA carboxylase biotin carboxyl carrier protein [Tundrisphaera sp. TA3]|uniref:acetyl-CoA carboxylase biotin carboxyl carrier protein n=1 Tax=Tundrisphaera sp. TA3 TaxID=3435775 RepID=UPI003EB9518E